MAEVLVADDDVDVRGLIELTLQHAGHIVYTAADGEQAWTMLQTVPVDAALLDVSMPGLDGIEVVRRCRAHEPTRDLRIALVSAMSRNRHVAAGLEAGADRYVIKPFSPRDLVSLVDSLVSAESTPAYPGRTVPATSWAGTGAADC